MYLCVYEYKYKDIVSYVQHSDTNILNKMIDFPSRLMQFIEYELHISVREFEKNVNLPQGTIQRAINGTNIGIDKIVAISKMYPDLNMDWLISGEGAMYDTNIKHNVANEPHTIYNIDLVRSVFNLTESNKILAQSVQKAIDANVKLIERYQ